MQAVKMVITSYILLSILLSEIHTQVYNRTELHGQGRGIYKEDLATLPRSNQPLKLSAAVARVCIWAESDACTLLYISDWNIHVLFRHSVQ